LPSATPTANITPTPESTSSTNSGLSAGAIVGLSIGVAVGALLFVGAGAFLLWRHWRSKKEEKNVPDVEQKGPQGGMADMPKYGQPAAAIWQGPGTRELDTPTVYHELPNEERPAEIQGEAMRGELDSSPATAELHSEDLPPRYHHEGGASPGAYGQFKGPT
jgi:hypothetical protein